jgi:HEAT repeat protein/energy-coupling factor transporter ATP-binding protein EcfA2
MRFDFGSFIIGAVVAFVVSFVLYKRRDVLSGVWQKIRAKAQDFRNRLTASVEQRYTDALLAYCDQLVITGGQADFDTVYVAQHFDPPPARPTLNPDAVTAPARASISVGLRSTARLAVLGQSGAGRTTLLAHLTRICLQKEARVRLGIAEKTPILLHLAEVDWQKASDADPLNTLLTGATAHVSSLIAVNVTSLLKNKVRAATALWLIDGLDEITPQQRERALGWLRAILEAYPRVQIVVTTGLYGYGTLQNLGFGALRLAGWDTDEVNAFTAKWINLIGGGRQDRKVLTESIQQMSDVTANPLELTLALIDWRTRTRFPTSRIEVYTRWLERAVRPEGVPSDLLTPEQLSAALGKVAWVLHLEERLDIGLDEIQKAITEVRPTPTPTPTGAKEPKVAASPAAIARAIADDSGLFIPFGADAYAFAHRRLAAYLAAYYTQHADAPLDEHWGKAAWEEVFDFCAALTDPAPLVIRALNSPDDFSRSRLREAARWTGYAAPEAAWRSRTMGELARTLLQPDQFTPVRESALRGLLETHDKGLAFLLKRGLAQTDLQIRALCLQGLGELGREADLPLFNSAAKDRHPDIREAALQAIGKMARRGSASASEVLIRLLLELDEDGQRRVAELLARCGEDGHQILREAATEDEIKVRRAATFGLAATGEAWARELLQKMEREESQWYVRTAAVDALHVMEAQAAPAGQQPTLDLSPVLIDQQPWLVEWAAQQGLGIGVGRQAMKALMRALDQGQPNVRQAALQTLRYTGDLELHDKLRDLLTDPDKSVRDAAYLTLEAISQRTGVILPR